MSSLKNISIIGLGYVGLPLALQSEKKGFSVTGIDLDKSKINQLREGVSPIDEEPLHQQMKNTRVNFSSDLKELQQADAVIICVPTPVHDNKEPDLKPLTNAIKDVIQHIKEDTLLVIESTINPGVCDEIIIPLIEDSSDFKVGNNLYLAHCPERINPGDPTWHVGNINRVVGANDTKSLELALSLYTQLIDAEIKPMGNIKEAEAVKIVENSFRDINIAFVNELAMSFHILGINVKNVIDGAATKPFAFMAHYPGIGVGGHCIPVDPYYLIEHAKHNGFDHKFLSLARSINESMPKHSIDIIEKALKASGQQLSEKTVAVLGLSYKANVGDDRESPAYSAVKELQKRGARVIKYDPHMLEQSDCDNLDEAIQQAQVILLATAHSDFLQIKPETIKHIELFFDGRNAFQSQKETFAKASVSYIGIGT